MPAPIRDLGVACQIGYVVPDIEIAMNEWCTALGGGPFIYFPDRGVSRAVYRGQSVELRSRMAFTYVGDTQFEFVQPVDELPSPYRDFLDSGRSGPQHLGFWVQDTVRTGERLREGGYHACFTGISGSFGRGFAFYEKIGSPSAPMLEILEDQPDKRAFYGAVRDAVLTWDVDERVLSFASFDAFRQHAATYAGKDHSHG